MRWLLIVALALIGCAPRTQSPVQQSVLPSSTVMALVGSFNGTFASLGLEHLTATGQRTLPNTDDTLLLIAQQFKRASAGFCPVFPTSFVSDDTGRRFMTMLAQGTEVRLLIYDRSGTAGLLSVVLLGKTVSPLNVKPCT